MLNLVFIPIARKKFDVAFSVQVNAKLMSSIKDFFIVMSRLNITMPHDLL